MLKQKFYIYLLVLVFFSNCASTKKVKQNISKKEISTIVYKKNKELIKEEINNFIINKITDKNLLEIIQEETTISKKVIDSAGVKITVPETTIRKTIIKNAKEKEIFNLDTTKKEIDTFKITEKDSIAIDKSEEKEIKEKEIKGGIIDIIIKIIIFVGILILVARIIIKKIRII
tara:strand:+ start:61 stop:582 length:522 start_codon:yes stop_codon:yes gene_type:complete